MPKYRPPSENDERQDLLNCFKVLAIGLFGWFAIRVALVPFEQGTFTPSNPGLQIGVHRNASSLLDIDTSKQRVVLIVGPHETLQRDLLQWARSPEMLQDWAYPIPTREDLSALQYSAPARYYSFDPLFATLHNDACYYRFETINEKVQTAVIDMYRRRAQTAWADGKNIVIASNGATHLEDPIVMDKWLRSLPAGVKLEDVQVVITYPTPRFHQLIQVWNEQNYAYNTTTTTTTTLTKFIKTSLNEHFPHVNPLGVAGAFVKKGIQTIILDEKGLERERVDLSTAVGCFILKVRCNTNGMIGVADYRRDEEAATPIPVAFSQNKLKRMEKVLQDFDCGFFDDLSKPSNVHFLYREALFRSCSSLIRQYTAKEVVRKIQSIARGP